MKPVSHLLGVRKHKVQIECEDMLGPAFISSSGCIVFGHSSYAIRVLIADCGFAAYVVYMGISTCYCDQQCLYLMPFIAKL